MLSRAKQKGTRVAHFLYPKKPSNSERILVVLLFPKKKSSNYCKCPRFVQPISADKIRVL